MPQVLLQEEPLKFAALSPLLVLYEVKRNLESVGGSQPGSSRENAINAGVEAVEKEEIALVIDLTVIYQ